MSEKHMPFSPSIISLLKSSLNPVQCASNNNIDYQSKYELCEQMRLERATIAEYQEEKSILSDQNNKLSKDRGFTSFPLS